MSDGEFNVGSPAWYAVQFGPQKSYREMLFGPSPSWHPSDAYDWNLPTYDPTGDPYFEERQ